MGATKVTLTIEILGLANQFKFNEPRHLPSCLTILTANQSRPQKEAKKSNLFQSILQDDQLPGRDHLHEVSAVEGGFENVDRNFAEAFRIELVEQLPPLVLHRHRAEQLFVVVIVELFGAVVILLRNRL